MRAERATKAESLFANLPSPLPQLKVSIVSIFEAAGLFSDCFIRDRGSGFLTANSLMIEQAEPEQGQYNLSTSSRYAIVLKLRHDLI